MYAFRRLRPREHSQCLAIIASSPDENSKIITKLIYHSIKPDATETRTSKGTKAIERDFGSLKLPRAEPRGCSHLGFTIIPWKSTKRSNQQDDHELKWGMFPKSVLIWCRVKTWRCTCKKAISLVSSLPSKSWCRTFTFVWWFEEDGFTLINLQKGARERL